MKKLFSLLVIFFFVFLSSYAFDTHNVWKVDASQSINESIILPTNTPVTFSIDWLPAGNADCIEALPTGYGYGYIRSGYTNMGSYVFYGLSYNSPNYSVTFTAPSSDGTVYIANGSDVICYTAVCW
jgi:hypothetical protein